MDNNNVPEKKPVKRPFVNNSCIWCWACIAICPAVFDFTDDWLSKAKKLPTYEVPGLNDAISACPVDSIIWVEEK